MIPIVVRIYHIFCDSILIYIYAKFLVRFIIIEIYYKIIYPMHKKGGSFMDFNLYLTVHQRKAFLESEQPAPYVITL